MVRIEVLDEHYDGYVYDISLDGTFVNANGMNIMANTDGINFQIPDVLDYDDRHPYISNGKGRNSVEGKSYTGIEADLREFEDMYLTGRNSIDIDEIADTSINFKRKNYANLQSDGDVKLVGNTLRSRNMPIYIEKFIEKGVRMLLEGKGREFLDYYYDYIDRIYNYRIPLREIASSGEIKIPLDQYVKDCETLTQSGSRKARLACYELAIKHDLKSVPGDIVYYVNTGNGAAKPDVQRITRYIDNGKDVTKSYAYEYGNAKRDYKNGKPTDSSLIETEGDNNVFVRFDRYMERVHPDIHAEDEIIFNCVMIPNDVVDYEEDTFCDEDTEYNVDKYIDMFNSRVSQLFVCFNPDIRGGNGLMIRNPMERRSFTDEECALVSGAPFDKNDQDLIDKVMTMEDKEIRFWISVGKTPPFMDECGMDWEAIKKDYNERLKRKDLIESELLQNIIARLSYSEVFEFIDNNTLPSSVAKIAVVSNDNLVSKKSGKTIGSIYDIIDKNFQEQEDSAEKAYE